MNHKKLIFLLSLVFLLSFLISIAHAETDVDISSIPEHLAEKMGIPLFAGQLLCSGILLSIFVLPTAILTRKRGTSPIAELLVGFVILGVCLALGWLPVWILFMLGLLVAFMYADKIAGKLGHRGD